LTQLSEKANIKNPTDPKSINIQKDPLHPGAYIISLSLDSEPSYVWLTLFEQELWGSLDFWDRKVLIVGKSLKLATTPGRVEEKLHWLEGLVVGTNKRVDEYNRKVRAKQDANDEKFMDEDLIRKDVTNWALNRSRSTA
jgi:hypothetical protein